MNTLGNTPGSKDGPPESIDTAPAHIPQNSHPRHADHRGGGHRGACCSSFRLVSVVLLLSTLASACGTFSPIWNPTLAKLRQQQLRESVHAQAIREHRAVLGMTPAELRATWGDPHTVNRSTAQGSDRATWVFGASWPQVPHAFATFQGGRLVRLSGDGGNRFRW